MEETPSDQPRFDRRSRLQLGLKAQLILWWSALVVVVLVGTAATVYEQRRAFLEAQLQETGKFVVRTLSEILRDSLIEGNFTQISNFMDELSHSGQVDYACLQDERGRVLVSAGDVSMRTGEAESYGRTVRNRLRFQRVVTQVTYLENHRFLEYATKIFQGGLSGAVVVRVGFDTASRIDRAVDEGVEQLMKVFLVAIPLGVGLSVLLAYWIARPLPELVEGAAAIARGDYDHPIRVESPRELSQLAAAYDHMRLEIKGQVRELKDAYDTLDRKVYELEVLIEVAKRMNFRSFSPELLAYLLDVACDALQAERGSLMMTDEADPPGLEVRVVRVVKGDGPGAPTFEKSIKLRRGEGIAGKVFEDGMPIIANEGSQDPRFSRRSGREDFDGEIRNLVCVPLMVDNAPIGVLNIVNKREDAAGAAEGFTLADQNLLVALASQAARSLENAKLYDQAIRESKTGLYVPRFFEARVHEELVSARRFDQVFSLVVLDIDFFKKVNDTYGHLVGDEVLIKLARFVLRTLREDIDVASRFGGEEFALMLPQTDGDGAAHVAERLRLLVEAEMEDVEKGLPHVTISVGVSTFGVDGSSQEELMRVADEALYEAKENGRNQVRVGREKRRYGGETRRHGAEA
jgi:diguanylate cyclase (GGDEF)-like protein